MSDDDFLSLPDPDLDETFDDPPEKTWPKRSPMLLSEQLLRDALPTRILAALRSSRSAGLLVAVPSPAWIDPIRAALKGLGHFDEVVVPDKKVGARDGESRALDLLSSGKTVAAVGDAPAVQFPRFEAAAGFKVELGSPQPRQLARIISGVTGKRAPKVRPGLGGRLDSAELCAANRTGSQPADCIRRLEKASAAKAAAGRPVADAPALSSLHGYGEAMGWALDLVADLDRWREGAIAFADIDRACVWASEPGLGDDVLAHVWVSAILFPDQGAAAPCLAGDGSDADARRFLRSRPGRRSWTCWSR